MKTFKELALDIVTKVDEDAPANAVGTGANVALPPTHEPGVDKKKKKKKHDPILINNLKRKVQENNDNNSVMLKGVLDKLEELDNIVDDASGVEKELIGEQEFQGEYTTFKDKYMGQMLNETSTDAAKQMEKLLVDCANGTAEGKKYGHVQKKTGTRPAIEVGNQILTQVPGRLTPAFMMKSGSITRRTYPRGSMFEGEPMWLGVNKTAKTDIKLGANKISLKTGSAQLMSGTPEEAESTWRYALNELGKTHQRQIKSTSDEMVSMINQLLRSGELDPKNVGGVDFQKGEGRSDKDRSLTYYDRETRKMKTVELKKGQTSFKVFQDDIDLRGADAFNQYFKDKLDGFLTNNPLFKRYFVYEAMTGQTKFDNGDATANCFLVVDYDGKANFHETEGPDSSYVGKILGQVKPDIKFKTNQKKTTIDGKEYKIGFYNIRSVLGLGYKATLQAKNECFEITKGGKLLTESILTRVKEIFTKAYNYVKGLIEKVAQFLKGGLNNIMEFLGIEPSVTFNNTIRW